MVGKEDHVENMKTKDLKVESLDVSNQKIQLIADNAMVFVIKHIKGTFKDTPFAGDFHNLRIWKLQYGILR